MDSTFDPSPTASNGRQVNGRFTYGNRFGKGNPYAKRIAHLRQSLFQGTTSKTIREVFSALVKAACSGDVAAAKLYLAYTIGTPEAIAVENADSNEQKSCSELIAYVPREKLIQLIEEYEAERRKLNAPVLVER